MDQNWPFGTKISHLGPKKSPGTVKSVKLSFCSFSATGAHWEKRKQIHIMALVQLFSIYMTSVHPRHLPDTLRHYPDTTQTTPDTIQTPLDMGIFASAGFANLAPYLTHKQMDWSTMMFIESPFIWYPTCLIFAHVVLWSTALWTARTTRRRRVGRSLT